MDDKEGECLGVVKAGIKIEDDMLKPPTTNNKVHLESSGLGEGGISNLVGFPSNSSFAFDHTRPSGAEEAGLGGDQNSCNRMQSEHQMFGTTQIILRIHDCPNSFGDKLIRPFVEFLSLRN